MTIICALHQDGETWIGADSRTTWNGTAYSDDTEKWVVAADGSAAVAICGNARARYLLERAAEGDLFFKSTAHSVADRLRTAIKDDEWRTQGEDGGPSYIQVSGIYASTEGVWRIACDFLVQRVSAGTFYADGSGGPEARGAAYVMAKNGTAPAEMLRTACEAAAALDSACGGPIFVRRLGDG